MWGWLSWLEIRAPRSNRCSSGRPSIGSILIATSRPVAPWIARHTLASMPPTPMNRSMR
jgi:hypothetical protein